MTKYYPLGLHINLTNSTPSFLGNYSPIQKNMLTFEQIKKLNLLSTIQKIIEETIYIELFESVKELVDMSRSMNICLKQIFPKRKKNYQYFIIKIYLIMASIMAIASEKLIFLLIKLWKILNIEKSGLKLFFKGFIILLLTYQLSFKT